MSNAAHIPAEWIDEIPTRPSRLKATVASLATAMLSALGYVMYVYAEPAFDTLLANNGEAASALGDAGVSYMFYVIFHLFGMVGAVCLVSGVLSLLRIKITYRILRASLMVVYPTMLTYVYLVWQGVFVIAENELVFNGDKYDTVVALKQWWVFSWPALAIICYTFWLHMLLASRSVYAAFSGQEGEPMDGDRILEDWRTHGKDPRSRKSMYWSIFTHVMVLVIIPLLLEMRGCVEGYEVPLGSGEPVVQVVVQKVKKKKKKKKLKLRKNSAFIYDVDPFEKSETAEVMEEMTKETYVANANPGRPGKGGGKKGGWPEGTANATIRFIRLKHKGRGWDDGMNQTQADSNFLYFFHKSQGFKTRRKGESIEFRLLDKFPKGKFPPFVYLTGNDRIEGVSSKDVKILREYCLKGGMLFADAGSNRFDSSFRQMMRQAFPGKQLIDISDDDILFQQPYRFVNGAPEFWHHGGSRAMGLKHEGRWIVFYHPGDMNDAWKSEDYSKVSSKVRNDAYQLGVNIVFYSFNQWSDAVRKLRK